MIVFTIFIQIHMAKMMEQGPVLLITFLAQQIMVVRNTKGDIVEGDPVSTRILSLYVSLMRGMGGFSLMMEWNSKI